MKCIPTTPARRSDAPSLQRCLWQIKPWLVLCTAALSLGGGLAACGDDDDGTSAITGVGANQPGGAGAGGAAPLGGTGTYGTAGAAGTGTVGMSGAAGSGTIGVAGTAGIGIIGTAGAAGSGTGIGIAGAASTGTGMPGGGGVAGTGP